MAKLFRSAPAALAIGLVACFGLTACNKSNDAGSAPGGGVSSAQEGDAGDTASAQAGLQVDNDGIVTPSRPLGEIGRRLLGFRVGRGLRASSTVDVGDAVVLLSDGSLRFCTRTLPDTWYVCTAAESLEGAGPRVVEFDVFNGNRGGLVKFPNTHRNGDVVIGANTLALTLGKAGEGSPINEYPLLYVDSAHLHATKFLDIDGNPIALRDANALGLSDMALKSKVAVAVAGKQGIEPGSIVSVDATVGKGSDPRTLRVLGSFVSESDSPRNVYEAVSQRLSANQCAVDPHGNCGSTTIRHTVYFDATARQSGQGGELAIDAQSSMDKPLLKRTASYEIAKCTLKSGQVSYIGHFTDKPADCPPDAELKVLSVKQVEIEQQ